MIIKFIIANVESMTLSNIYSVSISTLFCSLNMHDIEILQCLIEIYACFNTFKGRVLGWMQKIVLSFILKEHILYSGAIYLQLEMFYLNVIKQLLSS